MRPESTSVTFRGDLSAIANEYDDEQSASTFIGRRIAPVFKAEKSSGEYPIFNRENFKKRQNTSRAADGSFNRISGEFGKGTYNTEEHALEYPIDERKRALYAHLFSAEDAATRILRYQLLMDHEFRVRDMMTGAGFTNHNVATAWSDTSNATPLTDLTTGIKALKKKCGVNKARISLIIHEDDLTEMVNTTQVIDKVKYTYPGAQPAQLEPREIAAMLKIKEVIVLEGAYDSKEEGVAEVDATIWAAGVMYLCVLADGENAPLETPSLARTILWTKRSPSLPIMESYDEPKVDANIVRSRDDTDEVLLGEVDLFCYQLTNT